MGGLSHPVGKNKTFFFTGLYQQQVSQPAPQPAQQAIGPPPQLWGNDRVIFDSSDPMFKKWGQRAAPPYHKPAYKPPPTNYQLSPCWLFVEQMKEEKLMLPPPVNMPPPSVVPTFAPPGHWSCIWGVLFFSGKFCFFTMSFRELFHFEGELGSWRLIIKKYFLCVL